MNLEPAFEVRHDVSYGGGPTGTLCTDIYLPHAAGPHPVLFCLHGGAWARGSHRQYQSWGPWLAARGYAVLAVDYRLSIDVSPSWPGVFEDVLRAFAWLTAHATSLDIDPARIGVVGDSAGGHMAALLSFHEATKAQVRGVVGVYGIYDLPDWSLRTQAPRRKDDPVGRLMGKSLAEARKAYEEFSPQHQLSVLGVRPESSYLIIYGDEDRIVHHDQSGRFIDALRTLGADVESMCVPGAGHSWFTWIDDHSGRRRVDQWPNTSVAPVLERFLQRALDPMGSNLGL